MTIQSLPLSSLIPSPANVRKIGGTSIDDLAASIEAHGLIQTLTVRPGEKDKFEVVAGGRRLAALNRLLKDKRSVNGVKVTKGFAVDCRVLDGEDATEISLAENAIRQGMHPADQFDAFKVLADGGMSAADIAARFGLSEKVVRQRLKLASLSPVLLAAFRKDEMTIEQAMAFTVSDDHVRQEEVWKAAKKNKGYYDSLPNGIRSALTGQAVRASSGLAKAIGEDAYVAAGGAVSRDLFSTDDEAFWTDGELVERLAQEKLAEMAVQVKTEGWGEVMTHVGYFNEHAEDCSRVQHEGRPMTPQEEAKRDLLIEEQNALVDDGSEEATAQYDALDAEINAIEEAAENDWSSVEDKEQMLAVVVLDRHGGISVERGYVRNSADAQAEVFSGSAASTSAKAAPKEKPEFSASAPARPVRRAHHGNADIDGR